MYTTDSPAAEPNQDQIDAAGSIVLDIGPIDAEAARAAALEAVCVDADIWKAAAHVKITSPKPAIISISRRPFIRRTAARRRAPRRHAVRAGTESGDSDCSDGEAARRYAGVTGTPFILEKNRTVPIFGLGKTFNKPCHLLTKAELRAAGFFHFIEPAPITPSRQLKIDRKTKVEASGDFDTKVQACSAPMLSTIAEDTKAAMALLPADQRFLFFGSTIDQSDAQVAAHKAAGLNVESYHNNMSAAAQDSVIARFRAGEIRGLCTVSKVNRGFDCPAVSLVVIGFGTASRSKYEQMCGRAQRVFAGKTAAWVLDYGGHEQRFGSANWDYVEAIEFDRREKLRVPAAELAAQIASGKHDPKCEVRPDNFMDLTEATVDLFNVIVKPSRNGQGAVLYYVHSFGYTGQYVHANITHSKVFAFFRRAGISDCIHFVAVGWRRTYSIARHS